MMNENQARKRSLASVLVVLLMVASTSLAQGLGNKRQFAMEMKVESNWGGMGPTSATITYYVGESRMRMDIDLGAMGSGGSRILERNGDDFTTYVLVPHIKQYIKNVSTYAEYLEEGVGPAFGSPDDPEHPCQSNPDTTCEKLSADTFLGRSVVKYRVNDIEHGMPKESVIWFDPELAFLLKVESDDALIEAVSIDIGAQSADLFEIPPGWSEM